MISRSTVLKYLENSGVYEFDHSGAGLYSHLLGTERILKSWGMEQDLCLAGLLHSVFGTEQYSESLFYEQERKRLQTVVGHSSSYLIYLFGVMERKSFLDQCGIEKDEYSIVSRLNKKREMIDQRVFEDLCHLYVANRIEQHPRWPKEMKYMEKAVMKKIRRHICPQAIQDLNKEYKFELS